MSDTLREQALATMNDAGRVGTWGSRDQQAAWATVQPRLIDVAIKPPKPKRKRVRRRYVPPPKPARVMGTILRELLQQKREANNGK